MLAMESAFSPCFSAQLSSYPVHQGYPLPPHTQTHNQSFSPCFRQFDKIPSPGDVLSKYVEVAGRGSSGAAGGGGAAGVPGLGCPNLIPLPTTPPEMEQPGMWLSEPSSWYSRVMSADSSRYYRQSMDLAPPVSQQGCMNTLYRSRESQPQVIPIATQVTTQVTTLGPCIPAAGTVAVAHATTLQSIPENGSSTPQPLPPNGATSAPQLPPFSTDNDKSAFKSTNPVDLKTNLCYLCGKTYARPSTLKTHMRTHSGEKPYRCETCNKGFSQAANLTAHVRTHTGDKPFRCPVCDRRFSQSSSVTTHMRTHSGERPYKCKVCHKAFSDTSTLTKHIRVHSGEKPYRCTVCHLRFSQSGNLNRHMRTHKQQDPTSHHHHAAAAAAAAHHAAAAALYKGGHDMATPRSVSPYLPDRVKLEPWCKENSKIY